ncbi:MAG: bacterial transcriptional activator domain-containing protein [Aggregatilineales bacterium]
MKLHELVEKSYQTFMQQVDDTKVVLLHPESRFRSMLVARLINDPNQRVFYYALGPDDVKLQAFITSITHDMANQHPTFGRHINMLPQNVYENPTDHFELVLDTFAADLAEMTDERFLLILDEYDRSDLAEDVQMFVAKLAGKLPENGRMVINSRTLARLPWVSMIAQNYGVILKDDEVILHDFYNTTREVDTALEVFGLGPGFVVTNGHTVDTWEGHLPRLLYFFALDKALVTRAEICQAFWPELDIDQAVNVFHVTKRRLHKALDIDILIHDDGYYRVDYDRGVYYDANEFSGLMMLARNTQDSDERFNALQRAVELYRGPFLQGHNDRWILDRRESFRAGYLEALTSLAQLWTERGKHDQALTLLQKAVSEDMSRDDIHRDIMSLYDALGRRSEAASHYRKLKDEGVTVSEETQTLYKKIMG